MGLFFIVVVKYIYLIKIKSDMKYIKSFFEAKKSKVNFQELDIKDGETQFKVFRGRDAESNEYVTFELSDDEDIWFHAKGVPGSHYLIKTDKKTPSDNLIEQVAKLAAKNSKSKTVETPVVYCEKKWVTKEPGMNLGQVRVDPNNSKVIIVSQDE